MALRWASSDDERFRERKLTQSDALNVMKYKLKINFGTANCEVGDLGWDGGMGWDRIGV